MMSQIDVRPACSCWFLSFPRLVRVCKIIELSHMGKNNENPDRVCEKIISIAADIHILRMIESGFSYCIFKRFVVFNH